MLAPKCVVFRRRPPWTPTSLPAAAAIYTIDSSATGVSTANASVSWDLTTWTPTNVTPSALGDGVYRLTSGVDAGVVEHSVEETPTDSIRGPFTIQVRVDGWTGVIDSLTVSLVGGELVWAFDCLTGAFTSTPAAALWSRVELSSEGVWALRMSGVTTGIGAIKITAKAAGADYQGAAPATLDVKLTLPLGVGQVYATSIPNQLGASYPLTPSAPARSPKLYDPRTDGWVGEADYTGGWCGFEYECCMSLTLGASFAGYDLPITVFGDYRVADDVASPDTVWGLESGATAYHDLRLALPADNYPTGRRNDDTGASGTLATISEPTPVGGRRIFSDRFSGTARQVRWGDTLGAEVAQDVGECTFTLLSWGGRGGLYPVQGHLNSLIVVAGNVPTDSYHDRKARAWLEARHGVVIVTPPAVPPVAGTETSCTVRAPAGVWWALTLGGEPMTTGLGTGANQTATFTPTIDSVLHNTEVLKLTTTVAGTVVGTDADRIAVTRWWTPLEILTSLRAWHSGTTPPVIASWADLSGNGHIQVKLAGSWTLSTRNGRTTVVYGATAYSQDSYASTAGLELWVAGRYTGVWSGSPAGDYMVDGKDAPVGIGRIGDAQLHMKSSGPVAADVTTSYTGRWGVWRFRQNGDGTGLLYENGVQIASGSCGASDPGGLTISGYYDGTELGACEIGEVMQTELLTAAQAQHMTDYLTLRWI